MKVRINRVDDAFHFEASGASGVSVHIDGSSESGGHDLGARPMELLLMGLGGCSAFDVVSILKKQRQPLKDIRIEVMGDRATNQTPSVFTKIHMHFRLFGELDAAKVKKAITLSVEKYCSAHAMLEKAAEITHSYEIHETVTV
ncbi:MAG: OsmC family protein [Calditrichaeota bacterium]|nr:OsmC family protein [Calditrichota bacterium]MCB0267504.1 OsmC family protein [Calditrichota bacterium]MCB0301275.1 OsmC family protein [Calditrichota bacterium]